MHRVGGCETGRTFVNASPRHHHRSYHHSWRLRHQRSSIHHSLDHQSPTISLWTGSSLENKNYASIFCVSMAPAPPSWANFPQLRQYLSLTLSWGALAMDFHPPLMCQLSWRGSPPVMQLLNSQTLRWAASSMDFPQSRFSNTVAPFLKSLRRGRSLLAVSFLGVSLLLQFVSAVSSLESSQLYLLAPPTSGGNCCSGHRTPDSPEMRGNYVPILLSAALSSCSSDHLYLSLVHRHHCGIPSVSHARSRWHHPGVPSAIPACLQPRE